MDKCGRCSKELDAGWNLDVCAECLVEMPIETSQVAFGCTKCGCAIEVDPSLVGRMIQCPECMTVIPVFNNGDDEKEPRQVHPIAPEERYERDRDFRDLVDVLEEHLRSNIDAALELALAHHRKRSAIKHEQLPDNAEPTGDVAGAILQ